MATVFRARDLQKDRDVAIKFMKTDLGGSARRRFLREFNTISGINHPCCLPVYASLERKSTPANIQINTFGFVCRKSELEQIDDYLRGVVQQDSHGSHKESLTALMFTGDPGIGKTSIVEEASRKALSLGFRIYEGRCFDGDLSSFHPFVAIIRQILSGLRQSSGSAEQTTMFAPDTIATSDNGKIEQILLSYRHELLRIAPELRRFLPGDVQQSPVTGDGQYIYRALSSMFIELSQVRRLCLCLDDLQWADQSPLTLIKYLTLAISSSRGEQATNGNATKLAILCTGRSGYPAFSDFLKREQAQSHLGCVELKPFDFGETKLITSLRLGCHAGQVDDDIPSCKGKFKRLKGGSFLMLAITEPFRVTAEGGVPLSGDLDGVIDYNWGGLGSLTF